MYLVKVIKPAKFKDAEFQRVLRNAMRRAGTQVVKDFEKTTRTWKTKPKFSLRTHATSLRESASIEIVWDDPIYTYVNDGTVDQGDKGGPGILIWAGYYTGKSDKKVLAFNVPSTPKTRPGSINSGPGATGDTKVVRPYVVHHGIKGRHFDRLIKKGRETWFKREMEAAMREAALASGHAR